MFLNVQTEGNILENEGAVQNLQSCQENIEAHLLKISKVCFGQLAACI